MALARPSLVCPRQKKWKCWIVCVAGYRTRYDKGDPLPFYKYVKGFNILARYLEKAVFQNPKDLKRLVTREAFICRFLSDQNYIGTRVTTLGSTCRRHGG